MRLIENLLSKQMEDYVETCFLGLPFYYIERTSDFTSINLKHDSSHTLESSFMCNLLGCESHGNSANDIKYFVPIIQKLEETTKRSFLKRIIRVKANLYLKRPDYPDNYYHTPHVDMYDKDTKEVDPGEIFLYYVNDSDGDTFFFNEEFGSDEYTVKKRFTPTKGQGVLFDMSQVHASSSPRSHESRLTLNFVFGK
jgi:hypothetical protein